MTPPADPRARPRGTQPDAAPDAAPRAPRPLPRYLAIERDLQARIASGAWRPGDRVPPEHELQAAYGCSRMTVSKALTALARAGLIHRRRKLGSVVAAPPAPQSVLEIPDVRAEILASGRPYRFAVLAREEREPNAEDRARLGPEIRGRVLALTGLHVAGDEPCALEERRIALDLAPGAATESFAEVPPGTWLLALVPWTEAEHRIRAEGASAAVAARLGLPRGAPLLVVERRTFQAGRMGRSTARSAAKSGTKSPAPRTVTWVRLSYPAEGRELVGRFRPGGPAA